jgi:hypothetical protein
MNISEEIKRMMSLLESEMGNVKPLITEEPEVPVTEVDTPEMILTRAMSAKVGDKSCWDTKGFVWDKSNPFTQVNQNYLYALNKIDPSIKAGDPFVKIKSGDADYYMFGILSKDPQYIGGYLAVGRNKDVKASTDPNQNYLSSNGWKCDASFNISKNAASQGELQTASQSDAINKLTDAKTYLNNTGYNFYTSVPIGADSNYLKVDVATGKDEKGEQLIRLQDIDLMKTQNYGFTPGKFFLYMSVGASTQNTDLVKSVQSAIKKMGYTHIEPAEADSSQALSKTNVAALCAGNNVCSDIVKKYIVKNNIDIWPMTPQQRLDAAKDVTNADGTITKGVNVADQSTFSDKMNDSNRFKVNRSMKQGLNSLADRKSCQAGIGILDYCNTVNDNGLCEKQIDDMEAQGLISLGQTGFTNKINAIKRLLGFCVKNKEINLNNKYEGMLTNLQALSGQYGLATPINSTQTTNPGGRSSDVFESLNNSIKSVITEAINKNNNKNLDSIIKNNLRRYIR